MERQFGRQLPGVQHPPELYEDMVDVWEVYWHLARQCSQGMAGLNPISYADILAYCQLTHIPRQWWPRYAWGIAVLDHAAREKLADRRNALTKKAT